MTPTIVTELKEIIRLCGTGGGYEDAKDIAKILLLTLTPKFEIGDIVRKKNGSLLDIAYRYFDPDFGGWVYYTIDEDIRLHEDELELIKRN